MSSSSPKRAARLLAAIALSAATVLASPALSAREASAPAESEPLQPADSLEGNFLSAYIAGASRDTSAAATFYREAVKADPRNKELLERAFVSFLADGAMPEAFRAAERILARDPNNGLANLTLGVRELRLKRYQSARGFLSKGNRGRAADLTATLLSAWSFAGARDAQKAGEALDKLRGERAFNIFRDYHAGLIAAFLGNGAEADRRLKAAYEAERNTLRLVDAFGRNEARRGRPDAALAAYEAFDGVVPRHPIVRDAIARLKADKPLDPIVTDVQQGAAEVLYGLGAAGNNQGDELPAVIYLRLALHLDPEHALALVTLGDVFERLKRIDRANEIFARVPKSSPIYANAEMQMGVNMEQMGRSEEATRHLERLIGERPDDVDAIIALGNVLRSRKLYAEAADVYTRAIDKIGTPDRSHWTLFYFRGSALERAKQWPKAEADLQKALELVPESQANGRAQVLNYLGYSWVDMGTNIEEAFKLLKRAVELSPRDGMIIDSLGWGYYRLGRYEDAVRELERAVELKPGDPVVNDHLGDAYWRVGRRLEARFQWQHARDSNPEPEELTKIVRKLEGGLEEDPKPASAETAPAAEPTTATEPPKNGG
ncbi:tetratricopeptide repeat protein [Salinarimonas soli]|uniref:Tetratricopeptide repeat protein n=1 Tax=Salinarimonas soli TaxID=1638099 RepID=A0A5B2VA28_9HYPH|nr:tetratricopeptide repeat protein [Salinarimonas soli]KAA2236363.1 tetratricopeptide repeat protein [Salinarimonas soli]